MTKEITTAKIRELYENGEKARAFTYALKATKEGIEGVEELQGCDSAFCSATSFLVKDNDFTFCIHFPFEEIEKILLWYFLLDTTQLPKL